MMIKYANCEEIIDVRYSKSKQENITPESFRKLAKPSISDISPDGYLYVQVRAISSRTNKNGDSWPAKELAAAYKTFEGRPNFVDHNNNDPERTRGVVVWSDLHVEDEKLSATDEYYKDAPAEHLPPTWIELLIETDAEAFPKLAAALINGDIDAVSMGANIERSRCNICDNVASVPDQYCSHIKNKGFEFEIESATGEKVRKKSYEHCEGVNFFELSYVFDPADDTALVGDVRKEAALPGEAPAPDSFPAAVSVQVDPELNHSALASLIENFKGTVIDSGSATHDHAETGNIIVYVGFNDTSLAEKFYARVIGLEGVAGADVDYEDYAQPSKTTPFDQEADEYEDIPLHEPENLVQDTYGQGQEVIAYRTEQFLNMGFPPDLAAAIADSKADLHRVRDAISQGATPEQAFQIFSKVAMQKGSPYPEHSDKNAPDHSPPGQDLPDKVNSIYNACIREKVGEGGEPTDEQKESCMKIAWATYKKMDGKKKDDKKSTAEEQKSAAEASLARFSGVRGSPLDDLFIETIDEEKIQKEAFEYKDETEPEREKNYQPQAEKEHAPNKVDTLRKDHVCPNCGSEMEENGLGQQICPECGFEQEPEGFDNPDLGLARELDLQDTQDENSGAIKLTPQEEEAIRSQQREKPYQSPVSAPPSKSPISPVAPVTPVSKVATSAADTTFVYSAGIHSDTVVMMKRSGIIASVTLPDGYSFSLPPEGGMGELRMKIERLIHEYSTKTGVAIPDIPIRVEAADEESLRNAIQIIHSGGEGRWSHTTKENTSKEVIGEMEVTRVPVLRRNKAAVWAAIQCLTKKAAATGEVSDDEQALINELSEIGIELSSWDAATAIEVFLSRNAATKKVIINNTTRQTGTDEPTSEKVKSDQRKPVESSADEGEDDMEKESDRKVIKRVEEDGSGVKRTEEIVEESGPLSLGDDTAEAESDEEPKGEEETETTDEADDAGEETQESEKERVPAHASVEDPEDEVEAVEPEPVVASVDSKEDKLFAALRLAKIAAELGIIDSAEELDWVSQIEDESMDQIVARTKMLNMVKEAGLSRKKTTSVGRVPSLKSTTASAYDIDDVPIEAVFMS